MTRLADQDTRVIVQGVTGREGSFHTRQMIEYGTQIVGGVTPGKGGEWIVGIPVFDSVEFAREATGATASVIFVPAAYAADAIFEAVDAGIELIVCITEGIPILDMTRIYDYVRKGSSRLIGPNCPGLLIPGEINIGIMPADVALPGSIGVVSRSGTLTYEVINVLSQASMGQTMCVGIGGDPILGTSFVEILEMFENDPTTDRIVLLGEIGGRSEVEAAHYIKSQMTKPVAAFIAGKSAPPDTRMGHAGAIIEGGEGTAQEKIDALQSAGVRIAEHPEQIPFLLR
jgi:succinyl-CoA synthetase alpha subunit